MLEHELPCNRLRRRLRVEEHEERRGARSSKLAEHPLPFLIGRGSERQWRHGEPAGTEAGGVGDKVEDASGL